MGVPAGRGQEEPGEDDGAGPEAAAEDPHLQAADRGGRGDCRPQPGQVQEGPAGVRGDRGEAEDVRGPDVQRQVREGRLLLLNYGKMTTGYEVEQRRRRILYSNARVNMRTASLQIII